MDFENSCRLSLEAMSELKQCKAIGFPQNEWLSAYHANKEMSAAKLSDHQRNLACPTFVLNVNCIVVKVSTKGLVH